MRHHLSNRILRSTGIALATLLLVSITLFGADAEGQDGAPPGEPPPVREATSWPFAWDSIWNMPLGEDAVLVPAGIPQAGARGMTVDEDIIILEPDAPLNDVVRHDAGWSDRQRCDSILEPVEVVRSNVPIPFDFTTDPGFDGLRPNHSAAILMADGETIFQSQPFHRCGPGGAAVTQYTPPDDNIRTGDGIRGAHGGSGMSSLGGTVRVGELVPGSVIRHALKVNLFAGQNLAYDPADPSPGYRWPAVRADGYAAEGYGGTNPELEMGALLALPADFDVTSLTSEPARILAQAMQDYGAYVVDDTAWDVWAIETEWGPDGRVLDEFTQVWGHGLSSGMRVGQCDLANPECQWVTDMGEIFTSLHVVVGNGPATIGGAGLRRVPCAPPFADGSGAPPAGACPTVAPQPTPTPSPTPPSGLTGWLLSSTANGTIDGVAYADEDVLFYEPASGNWSVVFDGSEFGIGADNGIDLTAAAVDDDGSLLLAFQTPVVLGGQEYDDADVVRFDPSTLEFSMALDGSSVGLASNGERLDAVERLNDGRIAVSVRGRIKVADFVAADEDLAAVDPATGSWEIVFDGSAYGLNATSSGDINAVALVDGGFVVSTLRSIDGTPMQRAALVSCDASACTQAFDAEAAGLRGGLDAAAFVD